MKFFSDITEKFTRPAKVQVVEAHMKEDGWAEFSCCAYDKKKNSVVPGENYGSTDSLEALAQKLKDRSLPVIFCIDGQGILLKKTNHSIEDANDELPAQLIPNAHAEDFYYELTPAGGHASIVTLIRRNMADELMQPLLAKGFYITRLHLGPGVTSCLAPALTDANLVRGIRWRNYQLSYTAEELKEAVRGGEENEREEELPGKENFLKFSAACAFFSGWDAAASHVHCPPAEEREKEFSGKKRFSFYSVSLAVFFLMALLINFFVFQRYWKKQQELESQAGWQESALRNYEGMKQTISGKMSFALETGLLSEENIAWLADQLGESVPAAVQLTRLTIYPREKRITDAEEQFFFNQRIIRINGICDAESRLNDWIKKLKEKNFSGKVTLTSFRQDEEKRTGAFAMEIELKE